MEVDTDTYIKVIEELSYADGSVGWIMMATTCCIAGAATGLGPSAIDAMFNSDQGYIACGHIAEPSNLAVAHKSPAGSWVALSCTRMASRT